MLRPEGSISPGEIETHNPWVAGSSPARPTEDPGASVAAVDALERVQRSLDVVVHDQAQTLVAHPLVFLVA